VNHSRPVRPAEFRVLDSAALSTTREFEILELVCEGPSGKYIAFRLSIAEGVAEAHCLS
jgi:DNA-binding NarL/FixJ family response regulator